MDIKNYTTSDKIYCYSKTNVLKNKLNIKNNNQLEKVERYITKFRQLDMEKNIVKGNFDLEHLKLIHKKIFSDIYDFAGELRKVPISKGKSQFCYPENIETEGNKIFSKLKELNYLKNLEKTEFIKKLSEFTGDIIALHPFREGNGRAIREFVRILCLNAGYELDYSKTIIEKRLEAEIYAFHCNYEKLEKILEVELEKI